MATATAIAKSSQTTSAKSFFAKVAEQAYLEPEQEFELARQVAEENNEKARNTLVESHIRLVVKMAMPFAKFGFNAEDLISVGSIGLMRSVDKFEREKGFRFATYAQWWIKAAMMEHMLENRSLIRIPSSSTNKKIVLLLSKQKQSINKENAAKVFRKIAKLTNSTEDNVAALCMLMTGVHSMHTPAQGNDNESAEMGDFIADKGPLQDEIIEIEDEKDKRRAILAKALGTLKEREQYVFRYRRLDEDQKTLEELACELGVSRERVRQIEVAAFEKVEAAVKKFIAAEEMLRVSKLEAIEKKAPATENLETVTFNVARRLPTRPKQKTWALQNRCGQDALVYA